MPQLLYVENNREQFEKIRSLLEDNYNDYRVAWAGSGVPAQMILGKGGYDCVVSSYLLADLDGLTLLQNLRQNGKYIPFILVTTQKNKTVFDKALKFGADACLVRQDILDNVEVLNSAIQEAILNRKGTEKPKDELENLRRQAAFFQIDPAPVLEAKYNGVIIDHNAAALDTFGKKLKGKKLTDLFTGLNLHDIKIIVNYGVSQVEQKIGNETILFTFRSDLESKSLYVFGSNITDRINAEGELRKAHMENEMLLASISSILISVDKNGYIRQWNKEAEKTFGILVSDTIGKKFEECGINWRDPEFKERTKTFLEQTEPIRFENVRFSLPDGTDSFIAISVSPIKIKEGKSSGFLLLADDITERKILENQLSQAQKLEAIGQLAAGIAHEINTPTQYIGDNTHFIDDSFKDLMSLLKKVNSLVQLNKQNKPVEETIREIGEIAQDADIEYLIEEIPAAIEQSLEGIKRVTNIVKAMKEFSHPGSEEKTSIDINKALNSTITVARNEWKYVAEVEMDFDPDLPTVPCYPGELNQVFLNIITNAAHAIGDVVGDGVQGKGTITFTTKREGKWARILIADTGKGIPEKIRTKIFEPFFTTKEVGKGTGQGLAISHSVIVDKHGGMLDVESKEGVGTTFIIHLPLQDTGLSKDKKE